MTKIYNVFEKVDGFFLLISQVIIFVMMILTTLDVIARYFFNSPLHGVYDFTEMYLMVGFVFFSMSYVLKVGGHVKLDILTTRLSTITVKWLDRFTYLLSAILTTLICYEGINMTYNAWEQDLVKLGVVSFDMWTSYILVPIGAALITLRLIFKVLKSFSEEEEDPS